MIATISLRPPYLIFVGGETRRMAKTGAGIAAWRRELCAGQLRFAGGGDLGLPDMSLEDARSAKVGSLIIGAALIGGGLPATWRDVLIDAARAGFDVVSGMHSRLSSIEGLAEAAREGGSALVDVRVPPAGIPVGTGITRSGRRLLTVGTDCAVGKKYTALQLERDLRGMNLKATFRATGQTGIMIAGGGLPIDAVVCDFLVGAAELVSPSAEHDHWDVIEGQGSIFHPGYAPVSHGLLIGSQPDAFVVCHEAHRHEIEGWPGFPAPTIGDVIERTTILGSLTNKTIRCIGISVNTSELADSERDDYLANMSTRYGLPAVDPIATGTGAIVERLRAEFAS